ncbi:hypothetical protein C5167_047357 [Papaver somniferum]|uniref:Uncharacterized protein n=1 Tax=Papaver somniferum TaxID=3469 RepID=A0A4Y7LIX8_PAPSO|nr:hypothetical protein C5167_047357 [Papaver somniferum]
MHRRRRHHSGSANGPTHDQQLEAEQIQSLIDQRIKEHLGGAGSQQVGAAFNQHLDSYTQRPCLPVMLPTGMPAYGSQMPEAEQTQSMITLIDRRIKDHLGAAGFQPAPPCLQAARLRWSAIESSTNCAWGNNPYFKCPP